MDNKIDNSRALKFFEKWQNELSVAINPLRKPSENTTTHDSLIALVPPTAKKILEVGKPVNSAALERVLDLLGQSEKIGGTD